MTKRMGPGDVPQPTKVIVGEEGATDETGTELTPEQWKAALGDGALVELTDEGRAAAYNRALDNQIARGLEALKQPFPPEMIEHLPKQKWKDSWKDQPYQTCDECHGYHPLGNRTIHLDYVGHAGVTSRLLEVDPFWNWEPLAWTQDGLPRFDGFGGLWIKLTVCGQTRLGYGDATGKGTKTAAVKEIIGDAIRNAAMRFGVALDLWSKADLHSNLNPGAIDGQASQQRNENQGRSSGGAADDDRPRSSGRRGDAGVGNGESDQGEEPRAPNQDALDSLGSVCDENGFDRRSMRETYAEWAKRKRYKDRELLTADSERIIAFAAHLLEGVDPDEQPAEGPATEEGAGLPAEGGPEGSERVGEAAEGGGTSEPADDAGAGVGQVASDDAAAVGDEAQADPANIF